jgi:hypothetical protein
MLKSISGYATAVLLGAGFLWLPPLAAQIHSPVKAVRPTSNAIAAAHTERTFEFTVRLPMQSAAPLFGADKERIWAPGWNPQFIWPAKAYDRQGVVFTIGQGRKTAVWIAPAYDPASGFFQYAYVIPDVMVTLITLKLTPQDEWTHVAVRYERTALNAAARQTVMEMADQDSKAGPDWEKQINDYVDTLPK